MTADCIHQIELCPTCGGLQATTLQHAGEATVSITFDDGTSHTTRTAQLYIGPAVEPCERSQP